MDFEYLKEKNIDKNSYNKLREYKYNWVILIISLGVSLATVIILLFDKGIFTDKNNKISLSDSTLIVFIVTAIVVVVFLIFHSLMDKRFILYYTKNTLAKNDIIDVFQNLGNELENHTSSLIRISENLDKSPIENLISWSNSEKIEQSAQKVWAITYNLKWLTEERIKSIINELANPENFNREYHFIILNKKDSYPRINLVKKLKREFNERYKKENGKEFHFGHRFFILYDSSDIIVPLPNDVAIYQGFPDKGKVSNEYVVVNTEEFHEGSYDIDNKYDFIFDDNEQISRVKKWFEMKWNELYTNYQEEKNKK